MKLRYLSIFLITFGATFIHSDPKNNIQFGQGISAEGFGGRIKYVRRIQSVYTGVLFQGEERFELWSKKTPEEEKMTLGIPVEYKRLWKYLILEVGTGIYFNRFLERDELISSTLKKDTYSTKEIYAMGIPVEAFIGPRYKYVGLGIGGGYELNTFRSTPYAQIRAWVGY